MPLLAIYEAPDGTALFIREAERGPMLEIPAPLQEPTADIKPADVVAILASNLVEVPNSDALPPG